MLEEGDYILREIHERIGGNHIGPRVVATMGMSMGYYWPRGEEVQIVPALCLNSACTNQEMIPMQSPWPFAQWGIDLLGPFPRTLEGYKHLVVAIDYFTKWIEAEPLNTISGKSIQKLF